MVLNKRFQFLANLTLLAVAMTVGNIASAYAIQNLDLQGNEVAQISCPKGTAPALYQDIVRCQTACKLTITTRTVCHHNDQGPEEIEYQDDFTLVEPMNNKILFSTWGDADSQKQVIRDIKADYAENCPLIIVTSN